MQWPLRSVLLISVRITTSLFKTKHSFICNHHVSSNIFLLKMLVSVHPQGPHLWTSVVWRQVTTISCFAIFNINDAVCANFLQISAAPPFLRKGYCFSLVIIWRLSVPENQSSGVAGAWTITSLTPPQTVNFTALPLFSGYLNGLKIYNDDEAWRNMNLL